ncbi:hypothetical protein PF003_g23410 [Phytophthora fragariae]|nr:hypothetical protein PF003_g23410 [Phytophthora fragariae]
MKAKGKNFSAEEALQLCRSYLSINKDNTVDVVLFFFCVCR